MQASFLNYNGLDPNTNRVGFELLVGWIGHIRSYHVFSFAIRKELEASVVKPLDSRESFGVEEWMLGGSLRWKKPTMVTNGGTSK